MSLLRRIISSSRGTNTTTRGYWWGHDTVEDKEKRRFEEGNKRLIKWIDPTTGKTALKTQLGKESSSTYVPERIKAEADTLHLSKDVMPYFEYDRAEAG